MTVLKLFFLLFVIITGVTSKKTFIAKATGVKCQNDEGFVTNITCKVKAVKGRNGLLIIKALPIQNITDFHLHAKLYYKYGSAIYRPWMMDTTKDICSVYRQSKSGSINKETTLYKAFTYLNKVAPNLFHECPYKTGVEMSVENFDFDSLSPVIIPQLIPNGDYRLLVRFHTSKNKTIFQFIVSGNIKAIDKIEAYDMG